MFVCGVSEFAAMRRTYTREQGEVSSRAQQLSSARQSSQINSDMVPQTSNMVDVVIRSVRIYKVQKSGDLHDKLAKDVNLSCEFSPQGLSIKVLAGN